MSPPTTDHPRVADHSRWFAEEVHPHDATLRGYLRGSFPTVRDVDDVVQESYLRIWKARAGRPILSAKAFLFRVARNVALDLLRHGRSSPVEAVGDLAELRVIDDKPGVAERMGTAERIEILAAALDALPPRCREIMILCKLQGQTYRQVAARFGISEKTVAEHVYRGAQRLGEELHQRGVHRFSS